MTKYIAVVNSLESAEKLVNIENINFQIYPLNLDIYNFFKKRNKFKIIEPVKNNTDNKIIKSINAIKEIENTISKKLNLNNDLTKYNKEVLLSFFHITASSGFNLYFELHEFNLFLIYNNNKWEKTDNLKYVHKTLFKHNTLYLRKVLEIFDSKKKQKFPQLIEFINYLYFNLLKKNKCILTTTQNYGFDILKNEFLKKEKKLTIFNVITSHRNTLKLPIKYLLSFIINFFKKKPIYDIVLLKDNKNINYQVIKNIFEESLDPILLNIKDELINFVYDGLNYTQSVVEYSKYLLKKTNPLFILAHHIRWFEPVALAESANINKIPVILISHGSTPVNHDPISQYILEKNSVGMVFSHFANLTISHSPISEKMIIHKMPKLKKIKVNFWNSNTNWKTHKKNPDKKEKIILHAGTPKHNGIRLWVYESTFEYLNGLTKLINTIQNMENTKLIIRLRPFDGSSLETYKDLLPKSEKVIIKTSGNFIDDLNKSDLLISFASTTLEQALNYRKPVAVYGGTNRFHHLGGSLVPPNKFKSYPAYILNDDNLALFIENILNFHDNKNLDKNDLHNYIWQNNVNDLKAFSNYLLNSNKSDLL